MRAFNEVWYPQRTTGCFTRSPLQTLAQTLHILIFCALDLGHTILPMREIEFPQGRSEKAAEAVAAAAAAAATSSSRSALSGVVRQVRQVKQVW